ncbi:MAG: hypothetical protein HFJ84_08815 [Clostridiales bacterium]|nr:hypothetical protein [Clostridiales bacterium]
MFVAFIVELGEHGFFEDQKTKEEIKDTLMNLGLDQVLGNFKTFFQDIYNQVKQYDFGSAIKTALLNGFDLAMSAINLGQKIVFPIAVCSGLGYPWHCV